MTIQTAPRRSIPDLPLGKLFLLAVGVSLGIAVGTIASHTGPFADNPGPGRVIVVHPTVRTLSPTGTHGIVDSDPSIVYPNRVRAAVEPPAPLPAPPAGDSAGPGADSTPSLSPTGRQGIVDSDDTVLYPNPAHP